MMTHLDRELRGALEDLASAPAPSGLAEAAIRRAAHRRRAMRFGSVAACIALLSAAALVVLPGPVPLLPTEPKPTVDLRPPVVSEGRYVINTVTYRREGSSEAASLMLNYATGEYDELPYSTVLPSPDGTRAFVVDGDGPSRMGILDLATRQVEWVPGDSSTLYAPDWSTDGSRLVLSHRADRGEPGFAILGASTPLRAPSLVSVPDLGPSETMVWGPDSESLLSLVLRDDRNVVGVAYRTLTGERTRLVPVVGTAQPTPIGSMLASADHSRVLVLNSANHGTVVDTRTGAIAEVPLAGLPFAWVGNYWLLAQVGDGVEARDGGISLIDLTGAVVDRIQTPKAPLDAFRFTIGSAAGLPNSARHLTF